MAFSAGCGSADKENDNAVSAPKDELVVAIGGESEDGFDPTTGWGRYGSTLFQSKLFTRDKDLNIINDLATAYTVSDDGLTYQVDLRQDVKFSDGVPLTAADVVYTYETTAKNSSAFDLTNIQSVKALNDYAVQFVLKNPQSTFISIMAELGIVPKHAHNSEYAQKPIGSGPFKFVQWDKGQQLIAEVNPDYYGEKPFFKKITFLFLTEEAAFAAAKAGQVDIAGIVPSVADQEVAGMRLVPLPSVDNRGILFPYVKSGEKTEDGDPIGNDVTADLAIRKAINVALDRKALVDGVLNGYGAPAYSVCDHLPWWNPDTVLQDADLAQGKEILAQGGWQDSDGDGILEKNGLKATFILVYPSGDQVRQSLAIAASDQIKPLGINVAVEGKSWDEIETLMYSDAILFGWGSHDPLEMYNLFSSKYRGVDYYNSGYYSNAKVDEYLDAAMNAKSEAEANEYWKKAQWDGTTGFSTQGDAPWAWLVNLDHLYLVSEKLDIGAQKVHPHGHGWPITDTITSWHWTE
ncbi:nickel ABC transporter substrate-binding protein [Candidatus Formimonas warabiya]|uniref:Nickel ABC transporter substrate-binding protein n=2 Tax=Formimonas warabiya TaxID=1761012 RepID=A0A3G1L2M3_FORW1|nr:ABC transporter substrate-binding protein [Candidatus Formimonas warabiya]ATW28894.1 nickel ABC transporter substrate-binding protein [Candidatus Formimonas warabiya]